MLRRCGLHVRRHAVPRVRVGRMGRVRCRRPHPHPHRRRGSRRQRGRLSCAHADRRRDVPSRLRRRRVECLGRVLRAVRRGWQAHAQPRGRDEREAPRRGLPAALRRRDLRRRRLPGQHVRCRAVGCVGRVQRHVRRRPPLARTKVGGRRGGRGRDVWPGTRAGAGVQRRGVRGRHPGPVRRVFRRHHRQLLNGSRRLLRRRHARRRRRLVPRRLVAVRRRRRPARVRGVGVVGVECMHAVVRRRHAVPAARRRPGRGAWRRQERLHVVGGERGLQRAAVLVGWRLRHDAVVDVVSL
mmetsp:Transcript_13595/g.47380  ORF Transcript_13595/g.47380 Transcript_13595/m.47380 type:complete len:297 (+) Transcript_13595:3466-4356(+)